MRPLETVRVLEVGRRLGVASAGLALTALGAEVVQVHASPRDVPDAERVYYDRGRTVISPDEPLHQLAASADVIITDLVDRELQEFRLPVDAAGLRGGTNAQTMVTVRSLGSTGSNSAFRMTDLTEWASSGLAQVTRRPHPPESDRYVPVLPPGQQPQALAGLAAATAALVGRRWARQRKEPVVADVSVQEVAAALLHGIFPTFVWNTVVTGHPGAAFTALGMVLPALDGDVYIRTLDPRQWDSLMAWVGNPSVHVIGSDPDSRLANNDALTLLLAEWSSTQRRMELLEEGQRRRVPIAIPRSVDDVLAWQHLRARGVWRNVELEGSVAEAPRLPLLEPSAWRPATTASAASIADKWARAR